MTVSSRVNKHIHGQLEKIIPKYTLKLRKVTMCSSQMFKINLLHISARFFKAGLTKPRVNGKFEFRYKSLKSKFSLILSNYSLMVGYSNKNKENFPESAFNQQKKISRLKFNPGEVGTNWSWNNWA